MPSSAISAQLECGPNTQSLKRGAIRWTSRAKGVPQVGTHRRTVGRRDSTEVESPQRSQRHSDCERRALFPYEPEIEAGYVLGVWRSARREPPCGDGESWHGGRPCGTPPMPDVSDAGHAAARPRTARRLSSLSRHEDRADARPPAGRDTRVPRLRPYLGATAIVSPSEGGRFSSAT